MLSQLERIEEEGKKMDELWEKLYGSQKDDEKTSSETEKALNVNEKEAEAPQERVAHEEDVTETEETKPKAEEAKPLPTEGPKGEDWKHKYEVLKGKYDNEVPRLSFELAQANRMIAEMRQELESLKTKIPRVEEKPQAPQELSKLRQFKEEYPDIFDGVQTLIEEAVNEKLAKKLEETVKPISQEISTVKDNLGKTERERYLMALDSDPHIGKVWRTINEDPAFIQWLQEPEPFSGISKYQLLMDAWNNMDAQRTIRFFKEYQASRKTDQQKVKAPKVDVRDEELHPPRGQRSMEPRVESQEIITPEMYKKFTMDVIAGKYRGREAEAEKEEQRLLRGLLKMKP